MIIKIRLRKRIGDFMQTCPRHSQHFEYFSGNMHSHDILTQFSIFTRGIICSYTITIKPEQKALIYAELFVMAF